MPKTHWTKVVSAIAKRTDLPFAEAKIAYDLWRKREERPSIRKVKALTDKQLAAFKGNVTKKHNAAKKELERRVIEKEKRKAEIYSPRHVGESPRWTSAILKPAPKAEKKPKPQAAPISEREARNRFERLCKEYDAPLLKKNAISKFIASQWRDEWWQTNMAKTLAKAWRSIDRLGYVSDAIRKRLSELLEMKKDVIEMKYSGNAGDFWYGILKQLYV